jgi:hypothetical protein
MHPCVCKTVDRKNYNDIAEPSLHLSLCRAVFLGGVRRRRLLLPAPSHSPFSLAPDPLPGEIDISRAYHRTSPSTASAPSPRAVSLSHSRTDTPQTAAPSILAVACSLRHDIAPSRHRTSARDDHRALHLFAQQGAERLVESSQLRDSVVLLAAHIPRSPHVSRATASTPYTPLLSLPNLGETNPPGRTFSSAIASSRRIRRRRGEELAG